MDILSSELANEGELKIDWAARAMPVLASIQERFQKERPLDGQRIAACLHVTAETANLVRTLAAGGAIVNLCASNPLSTQDDVAAALCTSDRIDVFAIRGENDALYRSHLNSAADIQPTITVDDGADLVHLVHTQRRELARHILGGTEETTTGVSRLRQMAKDGVLSYPIIAVNNANTKHLFDNRYGTGQSTLDGIMRATNRLFSGRIFVVAGYGWCGRGLAMRAKGMGARVIVTEIDATKALEATMDGFQVVPMNEAAAMGDFFCTVTGNKSVIGDSHFEKMKDGAIICNAGHFDVEVDVATLRALACHRREIRDDLIEYELPGGRRLLLLSEGRLVNLAAAEGHPSDVMDMSFAGQALSAEFLATGNTRLPCAVHDVPEIIDTRIAQLKLKSMGVTIDAPTEAQMDYMSGWQNGT